MFPKNSASRFLVLLCLWTTLLAIVASHLHIAKNKSVDSNTIASETSGDYGYVGHTVASRAENPKEREVVKLVLAIMSEGTKSEHWVLIIDSIFLHALISADVDQNHLSVQEGEEEWDPALFYPTPREIPLGTASFKDEEEKWDVIDNMLYKKDTLKLAVPTTKHAQDSHVILQLPEPISKKGGNCMDYILLMLEYFEQHGYTSVDVMNKFRVEFKARYHDAAKSIFGVELQP
ncbi:hypothetical protein J3R30DRAFT_2102243 [Lentinula aciculospora]|uniref:Ubiquitin-like protease family profile domain-containing protein n=1 Tax=Lentinula aciculospora TaxID=153920 RepID=A0A9W9DRM0_9AGAR|nr:hypothetical protein J3R30DRAFT_2102243 [Lentinula aciculospora]